MQSHTSRTILHLHREKNRSTAKKPVSTITTSPMHRNDCDRKSNRVIEIRYRNGKAINPDIVSTAIDMRKRFFSLSGIRDFN